MKSRPIEDFELQLQDLKESGRLTGFALQDHKLWVSWVGTADPAVENIIKDFQDSYGGENVERNANAQNYFFFGDELRPGSGLIRVFGGKSQGPGGTLTCLLSSLDGEDIYFAAAAHVLTDFWRDEENRGSIYHYRKGFPPSRSRRFLGKVQYPSKGQWPSASKELLMDVGIVKLEVDTDEVFLKQRTTCFGGIEEQVILPTRGMRVMKCGSQETHWTEARVWVPHKATLTILGPDGSKFEFKDQIILRDLKPGEERKIRCANVQEDPPFAVPGDSGTIVVASDTHQPLGMLIAGSVLDGLYVVTPFQRIEDFFTCHGLVRMRA